MWRAATINHYLRAAPWLTACERSRGRHPRLRADTASPRPRWSVLVVPSTPPTWRPSRPPGRRLYAASRAISGRVCQLSHGGIEHPVQRRGCQVATISGREQQAVLAELRVVVDVGLDGIGSRCGGMPRPDCRRHSSACRQSTCRRRARLRDGHRYDRPSHRICGAARPTHRTSARTMRPAAPSACTCRAWPRSAPRSSGRVSGLNAVYPFAVAGAADVARVGRDESVMRRARENRPQQPVGVRPERRRPGALARRARSGS